MDEQCPMCKEVFIFPPVVICKNYHVVCDICSNLHFNRAKGSKGGPAKIKCPFCRKCLKKAQASTQLKLYQVCSEKLSCNGKSIESDRETMISQFQSVMEDLLDLPGNTLDSSSEMHQVAKDAMRAHNYSLAVTILMDMILPNLEEVDDQNFIGLGCFEETIGLSQGKDCKWFWKKYGSNLSLYDELNLCFLLQSNFKQQKQWFSFMHQLHPCSYKLLYCSALAQHNLKDYQTARKLYLQVIEMNDSFSKPHEMFAWIEYRNERIQSALESAEKCLKLESSNVFAKFVAVYCNLNFTEHELRQALMQIVQIQPDYYRLNFQIGLSYESQKRYKAALVWFEKSYLANRKNPKYMLRYAETLFELSRYSEVIQILNQKDLSFIKSRRDLQKAFLCLGCAWIEEQNREKGIQWLLKALNSKNPSPIVYVNLATQYNIQAKFKLALDICERFFKHFASAPQEIFHLIQEQYQLAFESQNKDASDPL